MTSQTATLLAATIASVTAFYVAYLQRKQMRQIELYRNDPAAGLTPPPTWLWTLLHSKKLMTFAVSLNILGLVNMIVQSNALTTWMVVWIVTDISVFFAVVALELWWNGRIGDLKCVEEEFQRRDKILIEMVSISKELAESLASSDKSHTEVTQQLLETTRTLARELDAHTSNQTKPNQYESGTVTSKQDDVV